MSPDGADLGDPSGIGALDACMEDIRYEKIVRSDEGEDVAYRSSKKVRTDVVESSLVSVDMVMEMSVINQGLGKEGMVDPNADAAVVFSSKTSFRDSLLGYQANDVNKESHEEIVSDDEDLDEDGDAECPVIHVSRDEKCMLRQSWRQTLIIKVM